MVRLRLPAAEIVVELPIQNVGVDRSDDLGQAAIAAGLLKSHGAASVVIANNMIANVDNLDPLVIVVRDVLRGTACSYSRRNTASTSPRRICSIPFITSIRRILTSSR
ncbi:hypothetical protein L6639_10880 [Bradyrhizobium sp. WYCCWR 12678]|nr:hypothetical protein [Bradyrhizobium zhengyangense]MCG2639682.1 hypothetical protein [Bradyrhizobium zhengyangense]